MRVLYMLVLAILASPLVSVAQSAGDFRTFQSGTWNNVSTWARFDGSTWVNPAPKSPTSTDGVITIRSPHVVAVTASVTIDQTIVQNGGTLTVSSGQVLTIALGTGTDLTNSGTINTTSEAQLVFQNGASYGHARDGGPIPLATWSPQSTCGVTGITVTAPTNLNPAGGFYNFAWNCVGQLGTISFNGALINVLGDLSIQNTNSQQLQLGTNSAPSPINIAGNLVVAGTSRLNFPDVVVTVNVGKDFNYSSPNNVGMVLANASTATFNINGNFVMNASGGAINFTVGTGSSIMNLKGDFTLLAGALKAFGGGSGTINFVKNNGKQTFTSSGSIINNINYAVVASDTLDVKNESALSGTGTFTLNGVLKVGSLNATGAIVANPASSGNIQTSGRLYNSGARIVYSGSGSQVVGSGHPTVAGVTTEISNAAGVTFNASASGNSGASTLLLAGNLVLTKGNLNIISSSGSVRSLTLNASVTPNSNNITISGPNSDLVINGSGAFGTFPFPSGSQSIRNFTFNRTSSGNMTFSNPLAITGTATITSGTVTFAGTTSIAGTTTLSSATTLAFPGQALTLAGDFSNSGGFLSANSSATLTLTGATALTSPLSFAPSGNSLNSLTLNKSNSGTSATVSSSLTVTTALMLTAGQLNITASNLSLNSGATITRNSAASISTTSPGGGPWNLIYTGGSLTTGLEVPTSGNVTSVTVNSNSGSTVALSQKLTVSGAFNNAVAGATFTSGNNNVSAGTFTNAGTFNAPGSGASSGLTLFGNFINNGTFNANAGTVIAAASLTMSGAAISTTTFNTLVINPAATLTPPATLTLQGNFTDNGSLNAGTGSVVFTGSGASTISGTTNTPFYNVTLNKSSSATTLSVSTLQTITNSLTLTMGQLIGSNLSMNSGTTLTRNSAASISPTPLVGGPWNLIYTGGSMTTSLEIPTSGSLLSLTVSTNNATTITLNQNVTVTNYFTNALSNRTFTAGNNNVTVGTFSNAGIFVAPGATATTGFTISGNFANDGTFTSNGGLVVIAGNVTMSGAAINTTNFNDITINSGATLTPPATLNIQGNFMNNGTFTAGTGTVVFSGAVGSKVIGGSTNTNFYNVTLNRSNAGVSLSVSTPETITNSLLLAGGQLSITANKLSMNSGTTITRLNLSSIVTSSPGGGPWNLVYSNGNLITGLEIPASGNLLSLTENTISGNTVTLNNNIIVVGSIVINPQSSGPIFTSGAHTISAGSLVNSGVFNAPTPNLSLTLTGDFTNNGTFNGGTGTVVFNGTSNVLGTSVVTFNNTFNNVTISSIGKLISPANMPMTGNFTNNGTFVAGTGSVTFSGTATQKIQGSTVTTFNNIQVNNTANPGVSVESNEDLIGTLTLGSNSKFDADGASNTAVFTLLSLNDHPVQDAAVAAIPNTSSVVGSVTVQRYMGPANNDDRFLSFPVTAATVAQLQDNFAVTGNFTGTSYPCTGCQNNGSSLLYYDETVPGTFQDGYMQTPVGGGTNAEVLVPGRGYDAWMWNAPAPITVDVSAPINQGTINFTVTRTNSVPAQPTADGWNLLGNPFPSAIQWNTGAGWTSNLIDPTVYVWDRQISAERMWNESTLVGNLPNGIISSGQAFFVYANTGGTPSLSINEQAKIANQASTAYYRTSAKVNYSAIRISFSNQKSMDESYVVVYDDATPDYDQGLDAFKLETGKEALLVAPVDEEKRKLGFYALNEGYNKDIPLYLKAAKEGTCQLSFTNENQFKGFENLFLVDKYLGQSSRLSTPYQFTVTKNALTMENRFIISRNEVSSGDVETVLSVYPNPVSSQLSIEINSSQVQNVLFLDNMGRVMGQIPTTTDQGITRGTLNVGNFSSGLYFVRVWTNDKVLVEKVVIR